MNPCGAVLNVCLVCLTTGISVDTEVYVQVYVSVWGWEASLIKCVGTKMFLKVY